jgi:hypothetical protein
MWCEAAGSPCTQFNFIIDLFTVQEYLRYFIPFLFFCLVRIFSVEVAIYIFTVKLLYHQKAIIHIISVALEWLLCDFVKLGWIDSI